MSKNKIIAAFLTLTSALCFSTYAIAGIGIQWGNDFSMMMDDGGEQLVFNQLKIDSGISNYTGIISGGSLPIYVNRTGWERKPFNIGAKFYIDIIPFIDAVELSSNYGVWEYKGSISYPTSMTYTGNGTSTPSAKDFTTNYATMPITLDNFDMGYLGIKNTPYMKLNFDLTVRKYIVRFPKPLKTLNIYGGGGVSLIFTTPVLSSKLVEDALGNQLNTSKSLAELSSGLLGNQDVMKAVLDEITDQFMTPHWGAHIDLGVMIKIPVMPFGIYVDGKFMIPFTDLDETVDVGGRGIQLNSGICFAF
jgi:hypothetical protein